MTQFLPDNRLTLLRNGAEYFPAIETAFDNAQRDIYLQTYIFEDDATGVRIAAALKRAAQRGIATRLLVDGFGSKTLPNAAIDDMVNAGVQFLIYRPEVSMFSFTRNRLRRMHRKLVVVDGKIGFVGGINVIDDMDTPGQIPPRYDYAVAVEGPLVASMENTARRLWTMIAWAHFKQRWRGSRAATAPQILGNQIAAFVIRDNLRHRRDIEISYLNAIRSATSEIFIACAYFFPGIQFRRALIKAASRGVNVTLLLQGKGGYAWLHYASRALYGRLLGAGVHIYEYKKSFMHAKVAVIDRDWATVGSSNIDPFSLLLAMEANIVVTDRRFAAELRQSLLDGITLGAEQVAAQDWEHQPLATKLLSWLSYTLARFVAAITGFSKDYGTK